MAPRSSGHLDPQHLLLIALLGGLAVAGMALLVPGTWAAYYAPRLWLPIWLLACVIHGGALLDSRQPWVTRIARLSRHQLVEWGGGAYAAIALVAFGWLEWARFVEFWQVVVGLTDKWAVREFVRGLFDFGLDSFMNGIFAFVWPAFWKKAFSAGYMPAAALMAWGVYECARWAIRQIATPGAGRPPRAPDNR